MTLLLKLRLDHRAHINAALEPDHGHTMIDDFKRPAPACPGYPITGRLRGLAALRGLQHGIAWKMS